MRSGSANKSNKEFRTLDEELEHQIKKSNLLETDRTAFYENAEKTKKKNNEVIQMYKTENK